MKALRAFRTLSSTLQKPHFNYPKFSPFSTALSQQETPINSSTSEDENSDAVFDSTQYELPNMGGGDSEAEAARQEPTWDEKYRDRANKKIFGEEISVKESVRIVEREEQKRRRAAVLAKALLEAAMERADEDEEEEDNMVVKEEDQKSLSVGIIGAPNAGKSALTNFMVYFSFYFFMHFAIDS